MKRNVVLFFSLLFANATLFGMEGKNEELSENKSQIVLKYDTKNQGMQIPIQLLSDKENILFQVIADPNWKNKKIYPIISYPPELNNYELLIKIDNFDFLNNPCPSHELLRNTLEELSIRIKQEHTHGLGTEEKKLTMQLDMRELGNWYILANKDGIVKFLIDNFKSLAQSSEGNSELLDSLESALKPRVLNKYQDEFLEEKKDLAWQKNENYYKTNKLSWFEKNPFKFASIFGFICFISSPFVCSLVNNWLAQHNLFSMVNKVTEGS